MKSRKLIALGQRFAEYFNPNVTNLSASATNRSITLTLWFTEHHRGILVKHGAAAADSGRRAELRP